MNEEYRVNRKYPVNEENQGNCRYFVTYSGVKLPLKLSQPLDENALNNRNTFFQAYFDAHERMTGLQKLSTVK
jgi:hypothetical protein